MVSTDHVYKRIELMREKVEKNARLGIVSNSASVVTPAGSSHRRRNLETSSNELNSPEEEGAVKVDDSSLVKRFILSTQVREALLHNKRGGYELKSPLCV